MLVRPEAIENSRVYTYVAPWGPKIIERLGKIIPLFKDMFAELETFFASLAKRA
jgi:membrane protein required for colicin V production